MNLVSLFNPVSLPNDPEFGNEGDLYYNTTLETYRVKLNNEWTSLINYKNLKISLAPEIFTIGSPDTASVSVLLQQEYAENILKCRSASLTQIVIPNLSDSNVHIGSRIGIIRDGLGEVEIVKEDDAIEFSPPSDIYLTKPGTEVRIINTGYNQWIMTGEFPDLY